LDLTKIPKGTEFNVEIIRGSVKIINGREQKYWKDLSFFKKLRVVDGSLDCYNNNLTSLEGCPKVVTKGFYCSWNNLVLLKYCP